VLVAMTGYGPPEEAQRGVAAGFDRYLVKPVDPEVLAAILGR
jgi:CheY-like chemotaxis protein